MKYTRVRTNYSNQVAVSADDYWKVLLDWPDILKWMPKQDGPVPLIRVDLKQGHEIGKIPCTRNCIFDVSGIPAGVVFPECIPETLLHVDPAARFIYYNVEGEGAFGMRNYLATTEVDELAPKLTRVTCSGRFDVLKSVPADTVKAMVEGVYGSIVNDIAALIKSSSVPVL